MIGLSLILNLSDLILFEEFVICYLLNDRFFVKKLLRIFIWIVKCQNSL